MFSYELFYFFTHKRECSNTLLFQSQWYFFSKNIYTQTLFFLEFEGSFKQLINLRENYKKENDKNLM